MALNKLKKWIGTQAMTAFFDQLNDNVDATNAVIDLAEQNAAGNFGDIILTDDPMSIADSMSHGEIKFFMTTSTSINGLHGWGIIVRRWNMRFITAFANGYMIYMKQRLNDANPWSGWIVPNS